MIVQTHESCERCGMGWLSPMMDGTHRAPHVCPEAYTREVAESLVAFFGNSGIPIHPRMKASIRLGLAPSPEEIAALLQQKVEHEVVNGDSVTLPCWQCSTPRSARRCPHCGASRIPQ